MPVTRIHEIGLAIEEVEGEEAVVGSSDLLRVYEPNISETPSIQEKNPAGASLSRDFNTVGRVGRSATFQADLTGKLATAAASDPAPIARLLRCCGYRERDVMRSTAGAITGTFLLGEVIEKNGATSNKAVCVGHVGGSVYFVVIAGTIADGDDLDGTESGATLATATTFALAGQSYSPDSAKVTAVTLSGAFSGGAAPTAGDVLVVTRSGSQVGSGQVISLSGTDLELSVFYGSLAGGDTLTAPSGATATVSALAGSIAQTRGLSATLYSNLDSLVRKIVGARGDGSLTLEAGQAGEMSFTFNGSGDEPVDGSLIGGGAVVAQASPPRFVNSVIETGYDRAGDGSGYFRTPLPVKTFTVNLGNTAEDRRDPTTPSGIRGSNITDRQPQLVIEPEQVGTAAINWGKALREAIPVAFGLLIGDTVNNRISIAAPRCQVTDVQDGEGDGLATHSVTLEPKRVLDAGDDELFIAIF